MMHLPALLFLMQSPCQQCHAKQVSAHGGSAMARTLSPAGQSAMLRSVPVLSFAGGRFTYSVHQSGSRPVYTVSDGNTTIQAPLEWAFGDGLTGQTYLFQHNGEWFETAVSFFPEVKGLDWTPGHATRPRKNLEEAAGRRLDAIESRRCFGCHTTAATWDSRNQLTSLTPGVGCPSCHQGADQHAKAVRAGDVRGAALPKLAALGAEDLSNICATCHPSWAEIAANGPRGPANVRHQIYRLTASRCYDTADRRISCAACHDLHGRTRTDASFYDVRCKACHTRADACKAASKDCVTCHMPKTDAPGLHFKFTDHRIRVVRAGAKYPD